MTRRSGLLIPGLMLVGLVALAGCPDNPYKAGTWAKKLGGREHERALQELEQLGDPAAIPDLGRVWLDQGKPVRDLQVIISLARPLSASEAKAKFVTDYEETGRDANWDAAMPFLTKALLEVDEANSRSVDSATKAADAIGEAKLASGLDALVEIAVNKATSKKLFQAQIASIRAIGKFENEKARAAGALQKVIDKDPPPHPRSAKSKEEGRAMEEKYGMFLAMSGASINSLGELRVQSGAKTLILSLYKTPELASQIRRALVASGPTAKAELQKVLAGTHTEVENLFKEKRLYAYCGDKGDLPKDQCQEVSLKDFYAALVLGDFYDTKMVPDLLKALERKALPAYYLDEQAGPTQFNAIFDALRKIGAADAADTVRAMWMGGAKPAPKGPPRRGQPAPAAAPSGADLQVKILAINAYAFLARDMQGVKELGAIAEDNGADDNLRQAAAEAFARLARNPADVGALNKLANKYFEASIKKRAEADGKPKTDADAADKVFAEEKKKNDEAKMNVLKTTRDPNKGAQDIKAATAAAKKSDDEFKVAKKKHKEATFPFKNADKAAKDYKTFARMFQSHIARIEVAIRCGTDLACYAKTLSMKPDESYTNVSKYFKIDIVEKCKNDAACFQKDTNWSKDGNGANVAKHAASFKDWDKNERLALLEGNVERAMLEIGKKGSAAASFTELLLDNAKSDNRLVRQSILLALPKIAAVPCNTCEAKLDAAIKAGEGKTTLGELNLETTMLRHYFSWAGGKTPSAPMAPSNEPPPVVPKAPADKPKKAADPAPAEKPKAPAKKK